MYVFNAFLILPSAMNHFTFSLSLYFILFSFNPLPSSLSHPPSFSSSLQPHFPILPSSYLYPCLFSTFWFTLFSSPLVFPSFLSFHSSPSILLPSLPLSLPSFLPPLPSLPSLHHLSLTCLVISFLPSYFLFCYSFIRSLSYFLSLSFILSFLSLLQLILLGPTPSINLEKAQADRSNRKTWFSFLWKRPNKKGKQSLIVFIKLSVFSS